ncbi:MAG: AraC family transcriptional regulator [Muricomes sp.]
MLAHFEKRTYKGEERVWTGRYRNLQNLPHWHLECELIYVEKGQVIVSNNHENYILHQGEAIFLNSGDIHYIKSEEDSIAAIFMFDPSVIRRLLSKYQLSCAKLKNTGPIPEYYQLIHTELTQRKPFFDVQLCNYTADLIIQIFRGEELIPRSESKEHSTIANYKTLLEEIEEKYSYITFSDAAAFMGLSEPYFSRFFRKISGMTFSQYLNTVKLEHAIELLKENKSNLTITEIASHCGFDTIRHFNRIFKEITGMTPRQMPQDYILDIQPILTIQDAFNPTLQSSELL